MPGGPSKAAAAAAGRRHAGGSSGKWRQQQAARDATSLADHPPGIGCPSDLCQVGPDDAREGA